MGRSPKAPPPAPPPRRPDPPAPVEVPMPDDPGQRTVTRDLEEMRRRRGRAATILTSPTGAQGEATVATPGLSGGNRETMG